MTRNAILSALMEGMGDEFREDNCQTRLHYLCQWLVENDGCYNQIQALQKGDHRDYRKVMAECAKSGIMKSRIVKRSRSTKKRDRSTCEFCHVRMGWEWGIDDTQRWESGGIGCPHRECPYVTEHLLETQEVQLPD